MPLFDVHRIVNTEKHRSDILHPPLPYRVLFQGEEFVTVVYTVTADDMFSAVRVTADREKEMSGLDTVAGMYPCELYVVRNGVRVAKLLVMPTAAT